MERPPRRAGRAVAASTAGGRRRDALVRLGPSTEARPPAPNKRGVLAEGRVPYSGRCQRGRPLVVLQAFACSIPVRIVEERFPLPLGQDDGLHCEIQPPFFPEDRECTRGTLSVDQAFRCLNRAVLGTHRAKSGDLALQHRLNLLGDLDAAGLVAVIGMH